MMPQMSSTITLSIEDHDGDQETQSWSQEVWAQSEQARFGLRNVPLRAFTECEQFRMAKVQLDKG